MNLLGVTADLMKSLENSPLTTYNQVPATPELPCAYCGFPTEMTDFATGGSCSLAMPIIVVVSRADESSAQEALSGLLTIDLILCFLRFNSKWWTDLAFTSINHFRSTTFGNAECLAADINLAIRTT